MSSWKDRSKPAPLKDDSKTKSSWKDRSRPAPLEAASEPAASSNEPAKYAGVVPKDIYNWATSVGESVPVLGNAAQGAGEHLGAGLKYLTDNYALDKKISYDDALKLIQAENKRTEGEKLAESPMSVGVSAPLMGAAMLPPVLKDVKGLVGATGRVGFDVGATVADDYMSGQMDNVGKDALVAGGIRTTLEAAPLIKYVAPFLGGVKKANIDAYLENPNAVRNAKSLEDIKDLADTEAGKIKLQAEELKGLKSGAEDELKKVDGALTAAFSNTRDKISGKVKEARATLQSAWNSKLDDLRTKSGVPLEAAEKIIERMNAEKAVLGALSEGAEDALAKTGGVVDKAHVLDLMDQIGGSVGVGKNKALIGEEANSAVKSFFETRQRIADALPDQVPYEDIRGIMRQVRADISAAGGFSGKAGEFNGTLTKMRTDLTSKMSDFLKGANPEYKAAMTTMAPRAGVLSEMSKNFGDSKQALSSLQTIVNGNSPRSKYLRDVLERFSKETGNTELLETLGQYEEARRVMGSKAAKEQLMASMPEYRDVQRAERALEQFNPKRTGAATQLMLEASPQNARVQNLTSELASVQDANKRFAGWSPMTSQNRLMSAMSGKNIENRRLVEELSARSGIDFTQMLDDRRVADSFEKGFMHGSRNVNLWSLIGSMFGGKALIGDAAGEPLMRFLGAGFGAHIDTAGPKMTKGALDAYLSIKSSRFGPLLEAAADRGFGNLATTHIQLQQTDPEYAQMVKNMQNAVASKNTDDSEKSFDPAVVMVEKLRIKDDRDMSNIERAKQLQEINRTGYVKLKTPPPVEVPVEEAPPLTLEGIKGAMQKASH